MITPQGARIVMSLPPGDAGTQALLAYASDATKVDLTGPRHASEAGAEIGWSSRPVRRNTTRREILADKISGSVSEVYRHADVQIVVEKTPAYILTLPSGTRDAARREHPDNDLRPGGAGYQQHLWQATLGRGLPCFCQSPRRISTMGPSLARDIGMGMACCRVYAQGKNWLQAIHRHFGWNQNRAADYARCLGVGECFRRFARSIFIPFRSFMRTGHPTRLIARSGAAIGYYGQKGRGLIGLWCSEPPGSS